MGKQTKAKNRVMNIIVIDKKQEKVYLTLFLAFVRLPINCMVHIVFEPYFDLHFFQHLSFRTDCLYPPTKILVPNDLLSYFFKCTHDVIQV